MVKNKKNKKYKIIKQNFSGVIKPNKPKIFDFEVPENTIQTKISFKKDIKKDKI